ncbi:hypothetical protein PROAA_1070046 [Candidatus Propionivibrio aalborgensis]|uniref:Uncharacterized protein n=1 Tax=Candidatus Propionivibrio aalborgensis TaxID=1860101 RepID=A0A1A8XFY9_9RHOO|nr:hypothetical protein PROAA_1070046 [Candidatus Propionivibrio aalborgensis]
MIWATRLFDTSSTVTGTEAPSSVKMRVMPTLRPTRPRLMVILLKPATIGRLALQVKSGNVKDVTKRKAAIIAAIRQLLQLNFDVNTGWEVKLHQRIDRFIGRIDDVHQA